MHTNPGDQYKHKPSILNDILLKYQSIVHKNAQDMENLTELQRETVYIPPAQQAQYILSELVEVRENAHSNALDIISTYTWELEQIGISALAHAELILEAYSAQYYPLKDQNL